MALRSVEAAGRSSGGGGTAKDGDDGLPEEEAEEAEVELPCGDDY